MSNIALQLTEIEDRVKKLNDDLNKLIGELQSIRPLILKELDTPAEIGGITKLLDQVCIYAEAKMVELTGKWNAKDVYDDYIHGNKSKEYRMAIHLASIIESIIHAQIEFKDYLKKKDEYNSPNS